MLVRSEGAWFLKEATTDEEDRALRAEATILRAARHPGVVCLVDQEAAESGRTRLRLARVDGPALDRLDGRTLSRIRVLEIGAALASTLADLHDIGIVHGAIEPSHVLVGGATGIVICGFSRARTLHGAAAGAARVGDVVATAGLVHDLLRRATGSDVDDRVVRSLARASRHTARQLARTLAEAAAGRPKPPSRRLPVAGATLAGALAVLVSVTQLLADHSGRPSAAAAAACPPVDAGCRPVPNLDDELQLPFGRFSVGEPADVAVIGRWTCASTPALAVLRPRRGQVFAWDTWPASGEVRGRLVATIAGATSLHVHPVSVGCDHLVIERVHRRPVELDLRWLR